MRSLLILIAAFSVCAFAGCRNNGEKLYGVVELVDLASFDEEAWKAKEVSVSGYVSYISGADGADAYKLDLIDGPSSNIERHVICIVPRASVPEGIAAKTVVVNGKIGRVHKQIYLDLRSVVLDSCEITKHE